MCVCVCVCMYLCVCLVSSCPANNVNTASSELRKKGHSWRRRKGEDEEKEEEKMELGRYKQRRRIDDKRQEGAVEDRCRWKRGRSSLMDCSAFRL